MRANNARAEELVAAAVNYVPKPNLETVRNIINEYKKHPGGHSFIHDSGATVVWGDITRLVQYLPEIRDVSLEKFCSQYAIPTSKPRRFVVHIDSVKTSNTATNVLPADLQEILGQPKGKADLLIVDAASVVCLSVKQTGTKEVKLGQQSTTEHYAFQPDSVTLSGGKNLSETQKALGKITAQIGSALVRPGTLSPEQWEKLSHNPEQRRLAILKARWPEEWSRIVKVTMDEAALSLDTFLSAAFSVPAIHHAHNLGEFLRHRLMGKSNGDAEQWITSKAGPFRLDSAIQQLSTSKDVLVDWRRRASSPGKESWIISATRGKRIYLICKIEPSFDGGRANVSQTKGVIYYFQEGSGVRAASQGSVWDLLADVSAGSPRRE